MSLTPEEERDLDALLAAIGIRQEKLKRIKFGTPSWAEHRDELKAMYSHLPDDLIINRPLPDGVTPGMIVNILGDDLGILFGMRFYGEISEEEYDDIIENVAKQIADLRLRMLNN